MKPFEFTILFFSFAYALALTHLLFAATRMVRHRHELVFSWPHALWMANALMLLFSNWISLYDFRTMAVMDIGTILSLLAFVTALYFASALVTPDLERGDSYDMRAFHAREGRTYISAFLVLHLMSFFANVQAAYSGVADWGSENVIVLVMLPVTILPLVSRNRVIQVVCPLVLLIENFVFLLIYYPRLGAAATI